MKPPAVAVLTGAGVSAGSGVPTFRGDGGFWRQHQAQDLATPQAFRRDPQLVWEFYDWRRQRIAACQPTSTIQRCQGPFTTAPAARPNA